MLKLNLINARKMTRMHAIVRLALYKEFEEMF